MFIIKAEFSIHNPCDINEMIARCIDSSIEEIKSMCDWPVRHELGYDRNSIYMTVVTASHSDACTVIDNLNDHLEIELEASPVELIRIADIKPGVTATKNPPPERS